MGSTRSSEGLSALPWAGAGPWEAQHRTHREGGMEQPWSPCAGLHAPAHSRISCPARWGWPGCPSEPASAAEELLRSSGPFPCLPQVLTLARLLSRSGRFMSVTVMEGLKSCRKGRAISEGRAANPGMPGNSWLEPERSICHCKPRGGGAEEGGSSWRCLTDPVGDPVGEVQPIQLVTQLELSN